MMRYFGLIGKKLGHSFSAKYFNGKFSKEGITDAQYDLYEIDSIEGLPELLSENPDLKAFNVTIPYKEQILPYLHRMDKTVVETGACNCVKIEDGKLHGFNTDIHGFMVSILPLIDVHHHSALVLGNGGASKAVVYSLEQWSIDVQVVARNPRAAHELPWNELTEEMVHEHKIIVNTTPLGMWPDTEACPDIPYAGIDRFHLCYDLIYNPEKTLFLQKAEAQDAVIKNGMEMLEQQAERAWEIWMKE
jgi:shikimate dehydrogenase